MWNSMMHGMMQGMDMRWMLLAQVVIWVAVTVGIVLIVREIAQTIRARQETPLDLVQRRLASGQISRDEYETVRRILIQADERHAPGNLHNGVYDKLNWARGMLAPVT